MSVSVGHTEGIRHFAEERIEQEHEIRSDNASPLIRERAPYGDDIDLDDLSKGEWKDYATICGRSLAHARAERRDRSERARRGAEDRPRDTPPRDLFVHDILRLAEEAGERVRRDHEHFEADHALDAFETIDRIFD